MLTLVWSVVFLILVSVPIVCRWFSSMWQSVCGCHVVVVNIDSAASVHSVPDGTVLIWDVPRGWWIDGSSSCAVQGSRQLQCCRGLTRRDVFRKDRLRWVSIATLPMISMYPILSVAILQQLFNHEIHAASNKNPRCPTNAERLRQIQMQILVIAQR